MDITVFYSCTLEERMAIINRSGEFISAIKFYGFYIHLYAIDGELVEVYYNSHSKALQEIEILDPKDGRLHLYAAAVNISGLYS